MAGHNKWSKIKHKKAANDQKKSGLFSKHLSLIANAAREDANPETNIRLKSLIDQAKKDNVPNDNIERALSKAAEQKTLEPFTLEVYGPDNVAIIVEAHTDNTNRTGHELRAIITRTPDAKVADPGSVLWAFEKSQETGEYTAKFPQDVSPEAEEALAKLVTTLKEHADVDRVVTSAKA